MAKDDKSSDKQDDAKNSNKQSPPPTLLSWSVRGISLLLIVFLVGYFAWSAAQPQLKPVFSFEILENKIEQRGTGWATPIKILNEGSMSVHTLTVTGTLTSLSEEPEESIEIMLLGPQEEVQATLWFDEDPRGNGLVISVGSYILP